MNNLKKVKESVRNLILEVRKTENKKREEEIFDILKSKYKMTAFEILALFYNPPVLEWRIDNEHLLFDIHYIKKEINNENKVFENKRF